MLVFGRSSVNLLLLNSVIMLAVCSWCAKALVMSTRSLLLVTRLRRLPHVPKLLTLISLIVIGLFDSRVLVVTQVFTVRRF